MQGYCAPVKLVLVLLMLQKLNKIKSDSLPFKWFSCSDFSQPKLQESRAGMTDLWLRKTNTSSNNSSVLKHFGCAPVMRERYYSSVTVISTLMELAGTNWAIYKICHNKVMKIFKCHKTKTCLTEFKKWRRACNLLFFGKCFTSVETFFFYV